MGTIIKDNENLVNLISKLNRSNIKIVMVNGCFDLFHVGHLNLLKFAKNKGHILITVINSDYSINRIKGLSRPIVGQNDRIQIVASLIYVDYAILFNEENPSELINIIKPDVIVKEEEYKYKKIPEIDSIQEHDINLIFYKKENNISTSMIINKILTSSEKRV